MARFEDIEVLSTEVAQGLCLSDEQLLTVEEWYATLDGPSLTYHVGELDRYIAVANTRDLSAVEMTRVDRHVKRLWSLVPPGGDPSHHPVAVFMVNFTKSTRSTPNFSSNFKRIQSVVMPYLFRLFNTQKTP